MMEDSATENQIAAEPLRLLHVSPSFGIGGVPLRMVRIINTIGREFCHRIIALDGVTAAAASLDPGLADVIGITRAAAPGLVRTMLGARHAIHAFRPNLLVTYNWGAIEWAFANQLLTRIPHIHHEAGFGREEADRQLPRRVWFRRLALRGTRRIVVPSLTLQRIAAEVWKLPRERIAYVPNGIDASRFAKAARGRCQDRRPPVIGTVAPLRPEKNVGRLVRAFAEAARESDIALVVAGDGSEHPHLRRLSQELGVGGRARFLGTVPEPEQIYREIDVFVLSSDTEQMPNSVLEAMATGLPIASVDVGDVRTMVCAENRRFVTPPGDDGALARSICALAGDAGLRRSLGVANLARVGEAYSHATMVARWRTLLAETARSHRHPEISAASAETAGTS